jgi:hypothetical protein
VYTNKGISAGESKETDSKLKKEGGCAVFEAGTGETEKACKMNKSSIGLAVFMWYERLFLWAHLHVLIRQSRFLWLTTCAIAGYAAWYYKMYTCSPFDDVSSPSHEIQETTKDAFSSNDEYAPINRTNASPSHEDYDEYDVESHPSHARTGSVGSSNYSSSAYTYGESAHPGRQLSWANEREPYAGIGGHAPIAPADGATMPDAPDDYSYRGGSARR